MAPRELAVVSRPGLGNLPAAPGPARITGFNQLASYSWWNKPTPTISVPGSPPLWSPPVTPRPLDLDSGTVYIDQNAARCPTSPLEPLFRALFITNPDFSLSNIDLVTDGNNIRKLLRFVQGSSSEPFRIRVEVAGHDGRKRTAIFTRVEPKTVDVINGFQGYGRNFENAYTRKSVEMTGYHRVVGYDFGGLRCLVRYEMDAYVGGKQVGGVDDILSDAVRGLSLSGSESETTATGLTILRSGGTADVDASSTLEIKTRAATRTLDMEEVFPQLWVSQTPNLAVGYHRTGGTFTDVRVRDVTDDIPRWEAVNRVALEKLAALLANIIDVVKKAEGSGAVIEYSGGSSLRIVAEDGQRALPEDLYTKWKDEPTLPGEARLDVTKDDATEPSKKDEATTSLIPVGTPFASDMEIAIQKGPRQFFVRLPGNIPDYRIVCQQAKSLPPETLDKILKGWSFTLKDIMADFRRGKAEWDPEEREMIGGLRTLARDAAFRLVYMLLAGQAQAEDRPMAYNAVFFVVSHSRIFGTRTRQMVRAAFEDRFLATPKQRSMMDKYTKAWPVEDVSAGDETSDNEEFYNSDSSDYW
ncbi:hypothetical protein QBC44DRAFT_252700 [Cladorrhinum sp. PSN332]|nr:hypothetical protein QBC44DRAFT_252700 [Cladorrhinum sp. PSN332]